MLERLQVHHGPGEILGEPVVDFVRDKLPLAFLDLQQLPEHVPFVAEGLLRRLERQDIFAKDHHGHVFAAVADRAQPQ